MEIQSAICVTCGGRGSKRCGRCKQEAYCSQDCQKAHWARHKDFCGRVRIAIVESKGRVLLASRQFKKGDIIFEEPALAFAIHGKKGCSFGAGAQKLCIGCARPVFSPYNGGRETHKFTCQCGFKFCSEACPGRASGRHDVECSFLKRDLSVTHSDMMLYCRALGACQDRWAWKQMHSFRTHQDS
eukprot:TRINITY_DN92368_c0_g1_i1.p1 TRINITY_DN92368_c0_g1~~TRINITY_DN92368_c0_g1_i1.p1  ORF type:complete len:185 (-),score=5.86 TRINITY_DN92368_c0_g1_i1:17-571(-)